MSEKLEHARSFFQDFRCSRSSLILATSDPEGTPDASTVPFIHAGRDYIVLISGLAQHTRNLHGNPQASVMLVEDEAGAENLFARKRIQLRCRASDSAEEERPGLLKKFRNQHGKIIELLSSLPDFRLVRLTPLEGQFVIGFGQAYRLIGERLDQLELIVPERPDQST